MADEPKNAKLTRNGELIADNITLTKAHTLAKKDAKNEAKSGRSPIYKIEWQSEVELQLRRGELARLRRRN